MAFNRKWMPIAGLISAIFGSEAQGPLRHHDVTPAVQQYIHRLRPALVQNNHDRRVHPRNTVAHGTQSDSLKPDSSL